MFEVTPAAVETVVEALRSGASQRQRAGTQLSGSLAAARREGRDVRSSAVRVVDLLAGAEQLAEVADLLEGGLLVLAPPRADEPAEAAPNSEVEQLVALDALRAQLTGEDAGAAVEDDGADLDDDADVDDLSAEIDAAYAQLSEEDPREGTEAAD